MSATTLDRDGAGSPVTAPLVSSVSEVGGSMQARTFAVVLAVITIFGLAFRVGYVLLVTVKENNKVYARSGTASRPMVWPRGSSSGHRSARPRAQPTRHSRRWCSAASPFPSESIRVPDCSA